MEKCPFWKSCCFIETVKKYGMYRLLCLGEGEYGGAVLPDGQYCSAYISQKRKERKVVMKGVVLAGQPLFC